MSDDYEQFLQSKVTAAPASGFDVPVERLNPALQVMQRDFVRWSLRRGRAALFEDCGFGKTFQQLEWGNQVHRHTDGGDVLVMAPLAVAEQTAREGEKWGIPVKVCQSQADVQRGVNVANYERLDKFDAAKFAGVVLDESGILKSYSGKTKQALCDAFGRTPYRLCCTATPAPNDHLELGNHAQFLGVMDSNEMISRWFINDTMSAGSYRLKGHAAGDFWAWVASWAVCVTKPSELGYSDDGYELPPLETLHHVVEVDATSGASEGQLYRSDRLTATTLHKEMRLTAAARAARVAELVAADDPDEPWVIWCNTDYEADALRKVIPGAIEVRGSYPAAKKRARLDAFSSGQAKRIITKPKIAGFGLNWQHCRNVAFVGLSYSWEQFYQALRRVWRFGQLRPVRCHVVIAATEGAVAATIQKKEAENEEMRKAMVHAMRATSLEHLGGGLRLSEASGTRRLVVPSWLSPRAA